MTEDGPHPVIPTQKFRTIQMVIFDIQPRAHTFNPEFWPHFAS